MRAMRWAAIALLLLGESSRGQQTEPPRLLAATGVTSGLSQAVLPAGGKHLSAATGDGKVALWDLPSGLLLRTMLLERGTPFDISPDGMFAVCGPPFGTSGTVELRNLHTGRAVRKLPTDGLLAARFSPDGKKLLLHGSDLKIRIVDAATGAMLLPKKKLPRAPLGGMFQPIEFAPNADRFVYLGADGTLRVWDSRTGTLLWQRQETIRSQNLLGPQILFASDGAHIIIGALDGAIRSHDAQTGKLIWQRKEPVDADAFLFPRLAVLKGGPLVVGTLAGKLRLVAPDTGAELRLLPASEDPITFLVPSPDGKRLLVGDSVTLQLWDVAAGKRLGQFDAAEMMLNGPHLFSADGRFLLLSGPDLFIYEVDGLRRVSAIENRARVVDAIAFSPDGDSLFVADSEALHQWSLTPGGGVVSRRDDGVRGARSIAISLDSKQALLASDSAGPTLLDFESKQLSYPLSRSKGQQSLHTARWSGDQRWLLLDEHLSGGGLHRLVERETGKELGRWPRGPAPNRTILSSARFSPDSKRFLVTLDDGEVAWGALPGGAIEGRLRIPEKRYLYSAAFSPDGNRIALGLNGVVEIRNLAEPKLTRSWELPYPGAVARFSPDGRLLVVNSLAGTPDIRILDLETGNELHRLRGLTHDVNHIDIGPNSRWLAVQAGPWVHLFDLASGKELCQLIVFTDRTWAVIDAQGRYDASAGGDITGLHWVVDHQPVVLKQLKERYYDPGLLAKHLGLGDRPLRSVEAFRDVKLFPDVQLAPPTSDGKLRIDLTDRGGGLGKVQIFVNGKEFLADARGPAIAGDARTASLDVDLGTAPSLVRGRENAVEVVTWNREGYLSSRGIRRLWTPPGEADARAPELHTLVVGISDYANPALKLRYASKDADDMARALGMAGERLLGAGRVHQTRLTSGDKGNAPSRDALQRAFESLAKSRPSDIVVVYLAGHGLSLSDGSDLYCFLTAEARTTDLATLADPAVRARYAVTSDELTEWMKRIPAQKQVMILDTCAAGAAARKLTDSRQMAADQIRAIERLKDRTGFHVLMGCAADRVSYEATQFEQGLLTHALLRGMRGAALDREEFVDVSRLFQYAANEVPVLARHIGGIQNPLIAAPRGTSFDIGRLAADDRRAVPLATPRPLLLRPILIDPQQLDDHLGLMPLLRKKLADVHFAQARGASFAVFVDADDLPGAIRPIGTYKVRGNTVVLELALRQEGRPPQVLRLEGPRNDLAAFGDRVIAALAEALRR